ncbi:MFS transporter [Sphingomonas kaistensis]|uniref:MFS transporter n=1 Tax=Sphingomonas kaistensis TaxID=298708 RepID=A0ABZ2G2F9_9SPHN
MTPNAAAASSAVAVPGDPSLARSIGPISAISLAIAAGFTAMMSFGTVQEAAKAEMGLSDAVLGLVQGVSAAVPLVLFSIPIGILVDRANRMRLFVALALTWTIGTALTAYAQTVPALFVGRMLAGIGTTGALTAALSLSADLCAPHERGRGVLLISLGKALGQAAAFAIVGWTFGAFVDAAAPTWLGLTPWRSTHLALTFASLACILPLLFFREPARNEVEAHVGAPFRILMSEFWQRRAFLVPLFAGQVTVVMADAAAAIWAAPVLSRDFGQQPQDFAGWMGAIMLLTGIGGAILGGIAADVGQKTGRRGGLLIGAVVAAVLAIPAALFPLSESTTTFAVALGTLVLCGTVTGLITSVALTVYIPNELRGLCIGLFIAVAGLIGFGIAPSLVTLVSSLLGGEQHLAIALAWVGVAVSIVSLGAFIIAMRNAPSHATKPV